MEIKTIRVDYWNHQKLTGDVLEVIQTAISNIESNNHELNCIPKMRKPYFWEIWKFSSYRKECQRILKDVDSHMRKLYWSQYEDRWTECVRKHATKQIF